MNLRVAIVAAVLVVVAASGIGLYSFIRDPEPHVWSPEQLAMLESMWIGSLPELPPDPSNAVADDPRAVALGHRLYFDRRFSGNGMVSCATCHEPDKMFTDALPLGEAIGTTKRHTPTIVGTAYSPWQFWDGRRDSQWAQAVTPMEDPAEHGGTRTQYAHLVAAHYADDYRELFGSLPDVEGLPRSAGPNGTEEQRAAWEAISSEDQDAVNRIYANMGKSIAAYERRIMPGASRFDDYVEALLEGDAEHAAALFGRDQALGLRMFIGSASCIDCHNGPLLTNNSFHNVGLPVDRGTKFDSGRIQGVKDAIADTFNCESTYSDAQPGDCEELRFVKGQGIEILGAFKVPTLRNIAETAPYSHLGTIETLRGVLEHYDAAPIPFMGHSDLEPLDLSRDEFRQLEEFLRTLSGPLDAPPELLRSPH